MLFIYLYTLVNFCVIEMYETIEVCTTISCFCFDETVKDNRERNVNPTQKNSCLNYIQSD